ncbi:hypothetical protein JL720_6564 [Aureococcus anophagefferens]|nr:hypothetical protein JL720_6564 [Aureococcus anophagefferens]
MAHIVMDRKYENRAAVRGPAIKSRSELAESNAERASRDSKTRDGRRESWELVSDGNWLPEELAKFRKIFDRVDDDRSGFIDVKELQELLLDLKHPLAFDDDEVKKLFDRVDKDGSGTVDFEEFVDLVYVELRDRIGLDHRVYGVPEYKLRRRAARHRRPPDVFALRADPFDSLLALEARGRAERARPRRGAQRRHLAAPAALREGAASQSATP